MKLKPNTMKLSDKTLTLLKNFSSINQSILFKKGNSLRTISVMKNILAEATIEEELSIDFGIYDLNQFMNNLNVMTFDKCIDNISSSLLFRLLKEKQSGNEFVVF